MRILVLDNFDSFTYNLVHLLEAFSPLKLDVIRNNHAFIPDPLDYDFLLLSPGPGIPSESGIMPGLIRKFAGKTSMLGVCLGMQAIAEEYGGRLKNLEAPLHGLATLVEVLDRDEKIFRNLPGVFHAAHYHSWVVDEKDFPSSLCITARDSDGNIMALRHKTLDIRGVQFHPESVLTPEGKKMIASWLGAPVTS